MNNSPMHNLQTKKNSTVNYCGRAILKSSKADYPSNFSRVSPIQGNRGVYKNILCFKKIKYSLSSVCTLWSILGIKRLKEALLLLLVLFISLALTSNSTALELEPKDEIRVTKALNLEKDPEKKVRLLLLLIGHYQIQNDTERELKHRIQLYKQTQQSPSFEKLAVANLHRIGQLNYQKNALPSAKSNFEELLKILPVSDIKTRYLTLQYLSSISSKLNDTKAQESYLAKYVISRGKTSAFYVTSSGFEQLLDLTRQNGTSNHHYYYSSWYEVAKENGTEEEQKNVLTRWVNFTTEKDENFSDRPFETYTEFLQVKNLTAELRELQLLYAESTKNEEKKAEIYQAIHLQNQHNNVPTDLGLLTFLVGFYDRTNKDQQKQEILQILAKREDYGDRQAALKELAAISLKNQDLLLSFNSHQELFKTIQSINSAEDLVVLDNLISLSQQLSKDDSLVEYLTFKALNQSDVITDKERHKSFDLLMDYYDLNQQYQEAVSFYTTFLQKGISDLKAYPEAYTIHFKTAFIAEKQRNFKLAIALYNDSLDDAILQFGYKPEFLKIAQKILQLTETHTPGADEFVILNKMKGIYQNIPDLEGVAKTELIIAQKHQKNDDSEEAVAAYQLALKSYRSLDDQARVSQILTLLANVEEANTGAKLERLEDLEDSLESARNQEELVKVRVEIGNYYKVQNRPDEARDYYLKAFDTNKENRSYLALQAGFFAALIYSQNQAFPQGNSILQTIVKADLADDQQDLFAESYQTLAKNSNALGEKEKARAFIDKALSYNVAELKISLLFTKTAILISNQEFEEALNITQNLKNEDLSSQDWLTLTVDDTKANIGLQRYQNALASANRGIGLLNDEQYSETVYELYSLKSHALRSIGDMNNAISNQSQLITLLQQENARDKLGIANLDLADLFITTGQLKNALETNAAAEPYINGNKVTNIRIWLNFAKINRIQNKLQQSAEYFEKIAEALDDSIPKTLQADIFYQQGFTYLQLSRFLVSLRSFEKSEQIFKDINQTKEARQARLAQANVLMKQGVIQQAEEIFQTVLTESSDDMPQQADIYASLAFLYTELGQYNKALENSVQAEKIYKSANQTNRLPEVLNARGLIFLRMNDFGQSEVIFLKALEQNKDQNNPLLDSEITNNLGGLYKTKGELRKARQQLIKTAELQKALGFESLLALTFNNIGSVYLEEGKYEEALDFLRQSREFASKYDLKKELAVSWNNEGILFFKQKKFQEAKTAFEKALELQKSLSLKVDIARTLNNLSIIAADQKDKTGALDLLQEAIATLSLEELDSEKFYPNPPQNSVLAASLMKDFLQNKGAFLREIANVTERAQQKNQYLEAAYLSFDLSISLIEALRAQIKSEESQQLLLQTNIDIYQQLIAILYELGERTGDKEYHQKAFFYAEKSRARSFLDQLQEQAARASLQLPKEIQDRENNLKSQISLVDKNIFTELSKPEAERDEKKIEQWQIEKTELQIKYTQLTKELEEEYPAYASLRYPTVYGVNEVKTKLLDEKSQIIVYFLGKDVSYGWRVSADQFEMISLPPVADIDLLIQKYRGTLADPLVFYDEEEELVIDATNTHLVTGLQIYRTFLEPLIGNSSESINNLLIVPDGVLYYLPFETVLVQMHSQTDKKFVKGREYLLNRYSIYYSPSTSVLGMIQDQARRRNPDSLAKRKEFVGFGDPQYQPTAKEKANFNYNPTLKDLGFYDMPRLLATDNELKQISSMFPGKATTYLRDFAVESTAKDKVLGYKYVHFATHGIMDEENPQFSGVVLNLVKEDHPQDGFLQASEIFDLKLDSDLVVLSACETGLGKVIKGEGMVGLTRAFLYAGSPSIVVSLWTVADESTSMLMIYFYDFLNQGLEKSEALRRAKLALMKQKSGGDQIFVDPFFWGPFVLNGASF